MLSAEKHSSDTELSCSEREKQARANAAFRICIFLLLRSLLNEVEHTFCRLVITFILICASLFREHKLPPLLITTKT